MLIKTCLNNIECSIRIKLFFKADYCVDFVELIPTVVQAEKVSIDNEKLLLTIDFSKKAGNQGKYVESSWYQKIDEFTKPVLLFQTAFTKTGILTSFSDVMGIYTVATTRVTLSKQEAINLAQPLINNYANTNGQTVNSIKAEFTYALDSNNARGYKHLAYPTWTVTATFDNSDKHGIIGYSVYIWGDSGEIENHGEIGTY